MGRVGFNFLRLKERKKDAEAAGTQQSEKTESVELNEFIQVVEEKNSKIRSIRLLLIASLTLTILLGAYIAFTKPRILRNNGNEEAASSEISRLKALNEEYFNKIAEQETKLRDLAVYKTKLKVIENKVKKDENKKNEIARLYKALQQNFAALQEKYNDLKNENAQTVNQNEEEGMQITNLQDLETFNNMWKYAEYLAEEDEKMNRDEIINRMQ